MGAIPAARLKAMYTYRDDEVEQRVNWQADETASFTSMACRFRCFVARPQFNLEIENQRGRWAPCLDRVPGDVEVTFVIAALPIPQPQRQIRRGVPSHAHVIAAHTDVQPAPLGYNTRLQGPSLVKTPTRREGQVGHSLAVVYGQCRCRGTGLGM